LLPIPPTPPLALNKIEYFCINSGQNILISLSIISYEPLIASYIPLFSDAWLIKTDSMGNAEKMSSSSPFETLLDRISLF